MKLVDRIGERYGRLLVTGRVPSNNAGKAVWRCVCDCGREVLIAGTVLGSPRGSRSCGCGHYVKHGFAGSEKIPRKVEYAAWNNIKNRCTNPTNPQFADYGGRGITVCERWANSFEAFLEDVGLRPSPDLSIDRINNAGNYEPGNVRWATSDQQRRNTRASRPIEFLGKRQCLTDWAREVGMHKGTLLGRLKDGWSVERTLTEPVHAEFHAKGRVA